MGMFSDLNDLNTIPTKPDKELELPIQALEDENKPLTSSKKVSVKIPRSSTRTPSAHTNLKKDATASKPMPSISGLASTFDYSPVLGRPKAFYITEKQHDSLNIAAVKLSEKASTKTSLKIDRSIIMRLLLEEFDVTNNEIIERLYQRLINHLVNRLSD